MGYCQILSGILISCYLAWYDKTPEYFTHIQPVTWMGNTFNRACIRKVFFGAWGVVNNFLMLQIHVRHVSL